MSNEIRWGFAGVRWGFARVSLGSLGFAGVRWGSLGFRCGSLGFRLGSLGFAGVRWGSLGFWLTLACSGSTVVSVSCACEHDTQLAIAVESFSLCRK